MEKISFFLEKFKSVGLETVALKQTFIEQVEKVLHTKLPPENVTIKDGVLFVRAEPALKSELYLKRELLVSELAKIFGATKVTGLR